MSGADSPGMAIVVLLAVAALVCALSALGLLVMNDFYGRLHYLAPPAVLATAAVAAALLMQHGLDSSGLKGLLVLLVMLVSNPVITYAAARAHYLRERRLAMKREWQRFPKA